MNPNKADVAKAYLNGLKTHGDPEMLKDIGIPVDPEVAFEQFNRGRELRGSVSRDGSRVSGDKIQQLGAFFCGD